MPDARDQYAELRTIIDVLDALLDNESTASNVFGSTGAGQNLHVSALDAGVTVLLYGSIDGETWVFERVLKRGDNVMQCTMPLYRVEASGTGHVRVWCEHLNAVLPGRTHKEARRLALSANMEAVIAFEAQCERIDVINWGPGDVYMDIDSEAAIDGADDVLLRDGTVYSVEIRTNAVHLISTGTPLVQVVGVR